MSTEEFVDQILTSLKVISMIKEGQKVKVRDGLLTLEVYSSGVMTGIRRWIHNDNRTTTLRYIRNTVIQAISIFNNEKSQKILNALQEAVNGLNCLAITYGDDAGITAAIDVIKDRITVLGVSKSDGTPQPRDQSSDPKDRRNASHK